ncbi:MAG: hypothetical protein ACPLHI_11060 [Pseudothermotoga sp.]
MRHVQKIDAQLSCAQFEVHYVFEAHSQRYTFRINDEMRSARMFLTEMSLIILR